jgi:hypothetical protein
MPTPSELARARDEFRHLLGRPTKESDWQRFFSSNPYVLSASLPLRLDPTDIIPLGRPGKSEPDFIFYPRSRMPVPYYGAIELKRPDSPIVHVPRTSVAILSRDANTAIAQGRSYLKEAHRFFPPQISKPMLFLGNNAHVFVIMGMTEELVRKLATELLRESIQNGLPPHFQLLPYDEVLRRFEADLPPRIHPLYPATALPDTFDDEPSDEEMEQAKAELAEMFDRKRAEPSEIARLLDQIKEIQFAVPVLPPEVLLKRAIDDYHRHRPNADLATPDSDPAFLDRIQVNYLMYCESRYWWRIPGNEDLPT